MASLAVAGEFLIQALFGDTTPRPNLTIRGAWFDGVNVHLDIEGRGVPDAGEVIAEFHVQRKTVTFKPA